MSPKKTMSDLRRRALELFAKSCSPVDVAFELLERGVVVERRWILNHLGHSAA